MDKIIYMSDMPQVNIVYFLYKQQITTNVSDILHLVTTFYYNTNKGRTKKNGIYRSERGILSIRFRSLKELSLQDI